MYFHCKVLGASNLEWSVNGDLFCECGRWTKNPHPRERAAKTASTVVVAVMGARWTVTVELHILARRRARRPGEWVSPDRGPNDARTARTAGRPVASSRLLIVAAESDRSVESEGKPLLLETMPTGCISTRAFVCRVILFAVLQLCKSSCRPQGLSEAPSNPENRVAECLSQVG